MSRKDKYERRDRTPAENFDTMLLSTGRYGETAQLLNGMTTGMQTIKDTETLLSVFLSYQTANFGLLTIAPHFS
jgi:hypothetical protein